LRHPIERVRQREHHVEVRQRQQLGALGLKPALLGKSLAFRAMAVAARAVDEPLEAALLTRIARAAQGGGAARADRRERLGLHAR
jgi:hypothetical protein